MTKAEILAIAKPILFNTEMVRAILDGRKTQTRRIVKFDELGAIELTKKNSAFSPADFARFRVGDYLYVRETWGYYGESYMNAGYILYRADYPENSKMYEYDGEICDLPKWRPSIHMPKEDARIFLRVTNVKVERLQDIDPDSVVAEGLEIGASFGELWDSTIKKSGLDKYGWTTNPWVWVYEFERVMPE